MYENNCIGIVSVPPIREFIKKNQHSRVNTTLLGVHPKNSTIKYSCLQKKQIQ